MIIIETKNGKVFVNDKKIEVCEHHKKDSEVGVYNGDHVSVVKDVVSISYISDNHDAVIGDEGIELQECLETCSNLQKGFSKLRDYNFELEEKIVKLENERDSLQKEISTVFIVVEDCDNDETRNVACFSTSSNAEKYCDHRNKGLPRKRFTFEEWSIGESYNFDKQADVHPATAESIIECLCCKNCLPPGERKDGKMCKLTKCKYDPA